MKNNELANWFIASLVALLVGVTLEGDGGIGDVSMLVGVIGFWVFSIWTIIRLKKLKD